MTQSQIPDLKTFAGIKQYAADFQKTTIGSFRGGWVSWLSLSKDSDAKKVDSIYTQAKELQKAVDAFTGTDEEVEQLRELCVDVNHSLEKTSGWKSATTLGKIWYGLVSVTVLPFIFGRVTTGTSVDVKTLDQKISEVKDKAGLKDWTIKYVGKNPVLMKGKEERVITHEKDGYHVGEKVVATFKGALEIVQGDISKKKSIENLSGIGKSLPKDQYNSLISSTALSDQVKSGQYALIGSGDTWQLFTRARNGELTAISCDVVETGKLIDSKTKKEVELSSVCEGYQNCTDALNIRSVRIKSLKLSTVDPQADILKMSATAKSTTFYAVWQNNAGAPEIVSCRDSKITRQVVGVESKLGDAKPYSLVVNGKPSQLHFTTLDELLKAQPGVNFATLPNSKKDILNLTHPSVSDAKTAKIEIMKVLQECAKYPSDEWKFRNLVIGYPQGNPTSVSVVNVSQALKKLELDPKASIDILDETASKVEWGDIYDSKQNDIGLNTLLKQVTSKSASTDFAKIYNSNFNSKTLQQQVTELNQLGMGHLLDGCWDVSYSSTLGFGGTYYLNTVIGGKLGEAQAIPDQTGKTFFTTQSPSKQLGNKIAQIQKHSNETVVQLKEKLKETNIPFVLNPPALLSGYFEYLKNDGAKNAACFGEPTKTNFGWEIKLAYVTGNGIQDTTISIIGDKVVLGKASFDVKDLTIEKLQAVTTKDLTSYKTKTAAFETAKQKANNAGYLLEERLNFTKKSNEQDVRDEILQEKKELGTDGKGLYRIWKDGASYKGIVYKGSNQEFDSLNIELSPNSNSNLSDIKVNSNLLDITTPEKFVADFYVKVAGLQKPSEVNTHIDSIKQVRSQLKELTGGEWATSDTKKKLASALHVLGSDGLYVSEVKDSVTQYSVGVFSKKDGKFNIMTLDLGKNPGKISYTDLNGKPHTDSPEEFLQQYKKYPNLTQIESSPKSIKSHFPSASTVNMTLDNSKVLDDTNVVWFSDLKLDGFFGSSWWASKDKLGCITFVELHGQNRQSKDIHITCNEQGEIIGDQGKIVTLNEFVQSKNSFGKTLLSFDELQKLEQKRLEGAQKVKEQVNLLGNQTLNTSKPQTQGTLDNFVIKPNQLGQGSSTSIQTNKVQEQVTAQTEKNEMVGQLSKMFGIKLDSERQLLVDIQNMEIDDIAQKFQTEFQLKKIDVNELKKFATEFKSSIAQAKSLETVQEKLTEIKLQANKLDAEKMNISQGVTQAPKTSSAKMASLDFNKIKNIFKKTWAAADFKPKDRNGAVQKGYQQTDDSFKDLLFSCYNVSNRKHIMNLSPELRFSVALACLMPTSKNGNGFSPLEDAASEILQGFSKEDLNAIKSELGTHPSLRTVAQELQNDSLNKGKFEGLIKKVLEYK